MSQTYEGKGLRFVERDVPAGKDAQKTAHIGAVLLELADTVETGKPRDAERVREQARSLKQGAERR
jgi:hypothetical protein